MGTNSAAVVEEFSVRMQQLQYALLKQPSYTAESNRLRQITPFSKSSSREANTGSNSGNFSQFKVLEELLQYSQQATIGPLF